jgi:hypothetical protein
MTKRRSSPPPRTSTAPPPETEPIAGTEQVASSESDSATPLRTGRIVGFALLCAVCLVVAAVYTVRAVRHGDNASRQSFSGSAAPGDVLASLGTGGRLLYLDTKDIADPYRKMAQLDLRQGATPVIEGEPCQRVYMAAGRGLCLTLGYDPSRGNAFIFDQDFHVQHVVPATGVPSRTRVSPDGRYGAMTFFVFGHAYSGGAFSTQTTLVDMATGDTIADLESFTVLRDGAPFKEQDFNVWGITFAQDSNRFYATLATGGVNYLVEGDIAARQARIIHTGVECPSLSPDGMRIVFKKRIGTSEPAMWRLTLLDLATMQETRLSETRSVDDQAEWLDNTHVLYTPSESPPGIWVMAVDGSSPPQRLLDHAVSPSVMR